MSTKTMLTSLIAIAIVGVIGYLTYTSMQPVNTAEDAMMKKDTEVMDETDDVMEKEELMMSSEAAMEKSEDSMMKEEVSAALYTDYKEGVIGNGKTSILFFHAKWCPTCRQADTDLVEMYGSGVATLPMYKVDYDTNADLKAKYGVTYQHTFVVIDGTGTAKTTVLGPSKAQLLALVK